MPWREKLYYQFMPIIEKHKNDSDIVKPTYAAHLVLDSLLRAPFYFTGEMGDEYQDWAADCGLAWRKLLGFVRHDGVYLQGLGHSLRHRGVAHAWEQQRAPLLEFHRRPGRQNLVLLHVLLVAPPDGSGEKYADVYGKVFRHRFSLNRQMKDSMQTDAYFVHPEFRFPCFEDVTRLYATDKSHTLTIGKEAFHP